MTKWARALAAFYNAVGEVSTRATRFSLLAVDSLVVVAKDLGSASTPVLAKLGVELPEKWALENTAGALASEGLACGGALRRARR